MGLPTIHVYHQCAEFTCGSAELAGRIAFWWLNNGHPIYHHPRLSPQEAVALALAVIRELGAEDAGPAPAGADGPPTPAAFAARLQDERAESADF